MMTKSELRQVFRELLQTRETPVCVDRLMTVSQLCTARVVAGYLASKYEVDCTMLYHALWNNNVSVYVPKYCFEQLVYDWVLWTPHIRLTQGAFGMWEPVVDSETDRLSLSWMQAHASVWLVPGLAFDRDGYRLGWGKGFYDRFLSDAVGYRLGIARSFQRFDGQLPRDEWDIPMQDVIYL